jgi:glutamate-1-semialdehyde 2,1-aminomutase
MEGDFAVYLGAALLAGLLLPAARRRLALSRAKHPSLAGHARLAKRLARWMPGYAYDEVRFFAADDAPPQVAARRAAGFEALASALVGRSPRTLRMTADARPAISDLQFIAAYRVPFPFSAYLRQRLPIGSFLHASKGVRVQDLDGNWYYDLTGSYGVNVFGHEFYKQCIREGTHRAESLGAVLGAYHPCVLQNVADLRRISGLDEVSFHMSGTEAVMQAVRLARYHTGRPKLVRFCGAYHGWWEDVQPGPGNPLQPRHTLTLKDVHADSLRALRLRRDVACVLVNPLQALHPNLPAPGDGTLVDSSRRAGFDREAYREWLQALRELCTAKGIVLIFDEVFVGFRLAPGGAQQYFGVAADLVTYGKTLGGGLPVGVVSPGRHLLRARYVQRASLRHGRHAVVSRPPGNTRSAEFLRRPRSGLGRSGSASECRSREGRIAGARRQPHVHLDGVVRAAVALQLDAPVLPAQGRTRSQLGRQRPADLQPRLLGGRFRCGGRAVRSGGCRHAAGRLVVAGEDAQQPRDPAPYAPGGVASARMISCAERAASDRSTRRAAGAAGLCGTA